MMKSLRVMLVSLVGFPLLVLGLILIPAPGPGLLVCLLALLILSTEFPWAKRYQDSLKARLKKIYEESKARADKVERWGDKRDKK